MVKRTWFRPSVRIVWKRGVRHVDSLQVAAEMLMDEHWPTHGPKLQAAALALGQALQGNASVDEARLALEEAARESGNPRQSLVSCRTLRRLHIQFAGRVSRQNSLPAGRSGSEAFTDW
jgi:Protein of unknown function (DUF982)